MWLPVAQRELLVASRKPPTYWVRLVAPALGLALLFLAAPGLSNEPPAAQGKIIFKFGALSLFLYCLFSGLYFTAESISAERRDGTLPLLQLTGLRELDLVIGKLLASAVPGIFGFFAAAPLLAIPFLLGGVTPDDFARLVIVLLGTLSLSLAAGVFASSCTDATAGALKQTLGSLFTVLGLGVLGTLYFGLRGRFVSSKARVFSAESRWLFVLGVILVWYFGLPTGSPGFLMLQVLFAKRSILPFNTSFAIGIIILFAMALYFLWSAKPFAGQDEEYPTEKQPELPPKTSVLHRRAFLPRGVDPFSWILGPTDAELILCLGWAFVAGALHFFGNALVHSRADVGIAASFAWAAFGITTFIYFLFARRAADFVVESRRNGMLEVLLVTPFSWVDLLVRHRVAFIRFVWLPSTILLIGEILGIFAAFRFYRGLERPEFTSILLGITVMTYVCSLFATLWGAIFFALRVKSATHAALLTVLLVLVAPALAAFFFTSDSSSFVPAPFFGMIVSAWIYIFADAALWAACRIRLNALAHRSPGEICDRRAFR